MKIKKVGTVFRSRQSVRIRMTFASLAPQRSFIVHTPIMQTDTNIQNKSIQKPGGGAGIMSCGLLSRFTFIFALFTYRELDHLKRAF